MKTPDVVMTVDREIVLLEPQNRKTAEWLSHRCQTEFHNVRDQVRIDRASKNKLVKDLKAAGFTVWGDNGASS